MHFLWAFVGSFLRMIVVHVVIRGFHALHRRERFLLLEFLKILAFFAIMRASCVFSSSRKWETLFCAVLKFRVSRTAYFLDFVFDLGWAFSARIA
jgi:hypothetical protein